MKIGLLGLGLVDWGGGKDMLRQFLAALTTVARSRGLEITVLLPDSTPGWPKDLDATSLARGLLRAGAVRLAKRVRWALQDRRAGARKLDELILDLGLSATGPIRLRACRDLPGLRAACISLRLDALVACQQNLGMDFPIPWCGYLPDVQHCRLPHMFSQAEIEQRDAQFAAMLAEADAMLATSRAVADDLNEFFGVPRQCSVLPMAWMPVDRPSQEAARGAAAQYGIGGPYFIICNQFWRHKDHETAFRAFAAVRNSAAGAGLALVCTGDTGDYRHKDHFPRMSALLEELGIAPHVRILGRIPKSDQFALLSGAAALIQPSLFEGTRGGLAVADALALARPCIVSDIAVNREIDEPGVRFFRVGDHDDLARQMHEILVDPPRTRDPSELPRVCEERLRALGESLIGAATAAVAARRTRVDVEPSALGAPAHAS